MAVAPARERGLKYFNDTTNFAGAHLAPARERGLKYRGYHCQLTGPLRSREGAWIEIRAQRL